MIKTLTINGYADDTVLLTDKNSYLNVVKLIRIISIMKNFKYVVIRKNSMNQSRSILTLNNKQATFTRSQTMTKR